MQENQEFQYTEYVEETNYIQSILFALIGGLIGIVAWLAPVYFFNYILFITVVLVGVFAALGARGLNRKKGNVVIAIIAVIATIVCLIIGDIAETAIALGGFDYGFENYFEYLEFKFADDPQQLFYYLGAVVAAGWLGFTTTNRN